MTEAQRNKEMERFYTAHRKAALAYCKRHNIDPDKMRCTVAEDNSAKYTVAGVVILTAKYRETFEHTFKFMT